MVVLGHIRGELLGADWDADWAIGQLGDLRTISLQLANPDHIHVYTQHAQNMPVHQHHH